MSRDAPLQLRLGSAPILSLPVLAELPEVPARDDPGDVAWLSPALRAHPGRMRIQLAREALGWARKQLGGVLHLCDPFCGAGTTVHAAVQVLPELLEVTWAERDPDVFALAAQAMRSPGCFRPSGPGVQPLAIFAGCGDAAGGPPTGTPPMDLLFTSPMFPNTHDQGHSETQEQFRATKATHAGNSDGLAEAWQGEVRFRAEIARTLGPWLAALRPGGLALIHVRAYVEAGQVQRVDLWVAQELAGAEIEALGVLVAPLRARSLFQEIQARPLVEVFSRSVIVGAGVEVELGLRCGHRVRRDAKALNQKAARCGECPPLDRPEVTEERIVVLRRRTG